MSLKMTHLKTVSLLVSFESLCHLCSSGRDRSSAWICISETDIQRNVNEETEISTTKGFPGVDFASRGILLLSGHSFPGQNLELAFLASSCSPPPLPAYFWLCLCVKIITCLFSMGIQLSGCLIYTRPWVPSPLNSARNIPHCSLASMPIVLF